MARRGLDTEHRGTHAEDVIRGYDEIEARLVAAGFPPTSPFWLATFRGWLRRGCRQLVARVGRRGGKSSSLSRLAVALMLYGHYNLPPGDTGYVAIISTDRPEALGRLRTIEAILDALGLEYAPVERIRDAIEIADTRMGVRIFTASIKGVSGFTSIFVLCDEVAKWKDADTGANPAFEVLASVRPTMKTQPNARIVLSSSPMGMLDAHYDAFERGDSGYQVCVYAPTWEANPTITEAETHADEPDEAIWEREYAAIPQAAAEASLVTEYLVDRARRRPPLLWDLPPMPGHRYVAIIDPATRGNAWTLVVLTRGVDGVRRVALVREWRGTSRAPLSPGAVFGEITGLLTPYRVRALYSDQWSEDALAEIARGHGLSLLTDEAWTATSKRDAYEALKSALQQQTLELHPEGQLKADVLGIVKKLTRNGVTYELLEQNGRHSDYAPALAMGVVVPLAPARVVDRLSDAEEARQAKEAFLIGRERESERKRRYGALPPTHRRMR